MKKVLITVFSASFLTVHGQEMTSTDSIIIDELATVEVKGIRLGNSAPFSVTNLNKIAISENNTGRDLPYFLESVPSVIVNSDAGAGIGYTDMRIRGTDNQRINLTINGIPVNDQESQGSFFVNFPDLMSSASKVQIQRGVGSSTNGAGAFGASVHINNLVQNEKAGAQLINGLGSFNSFRHSVLLNTGKLRNGFSFDARLSKITSDGYIQRAFSDLKSLNFLAGWSSADGATNIKFNLLSGKEKTGQAWNGVLEHDLKTNRRINHLGLKEDGTYYDDQTDNYQQDYYQLFGSHKWNNNFTSNLALFYTRGRGYYNEYRMDESFSDYFTPNPIIGNDTISTTSLIRQLWLDNHYYGSILSGRYKNGKTQIDGGIGFTNYMGAHRGIIKWASLGFPADYKWYDNPAKKNDINTFLKWENEWAKGLFTFVDVQFRSVFYSVNGFRKTPEAKGDYRYHFLNPKAGITYINNNSKLFISYAKASKEPNRDDFEAGIANQPKPEHLHDFEFGYERRMSNYFLGANLYWMQYKDQLINTGKINDVGAYTRVNVPNSFRRGIELYGNIKLWERLQWDANLTLSQNKIKSYTEYIDDYDNGGQVKMIYNNTDLALSPNIVGSSIIKYQFLNDRLGNDVSLHFISKIVGRQYLDNTQTIERSINAYNVHGIRLNYGFNLPIIQRGLISLNVNNIFNKKYESKGYTYSYFYGGLNTYNAYFPQAGINYMLTLTLDF